MTIFNLHGIPIYRLNYFISTSLIDGEKVQYFALENFVQSSRNSLKLGENSLGESRKKNSFKNPDGFYPFLETRLY